MPHKLHDRLYSLATLAILFAIAFAATACSRVPTDVAPLAGHYELRSVDGRTLPDDRLGGAIAGELVLTASGRATRIVEYATSGVPGPIVRRASGTFRRRGADLVFLMLEEGLAIPEATWEASGDVRLPSILIRYAGPRSGVIEERYVRSGSG